MDIRPKILIVDDDEINRNIIKSKLSQADYEIIPVENGLLALEIIKNCLPDLVLLDIIMPGITGYEVARTLKSNPETMFIPIVMITALDEVGDRVKALEAGADDFLTKPIDTMELKVRVSTLLKMKQYYDQLLNYQNKLESVNKQLSESIIIANQKTDEALKMSHLLLEEKKKVSVYANEMESLAEKRANQLIHADRMVTLGTMSAGIAHEINNPATFINVSAATLEKWEKYISPLFAYALENELDKKLDISKLEIFKNVFPDLIESIKKGTKRISVITNSLKSFARDDPAKKTAIHLEEALEAAITISGSHYKKIALVNTDVEDNLPQVMGNQQQMEQVFTNLIVNASDAIKEKIEKLNTGNNEFRGEIFISIKQRSQDYGQIVIQCRDNGIGMKEETKEKMFTPFFTTKPQDRGTGLGMSIVYGIIKDHNGTISSKSKVGIGTEFKIILPI